MGWNECIKSLPKEGERVLFVNSVGYMKVGEILDSANTTYGDHGNFHAHGTGATNVDITHWMNLPDAPK